MTPTVAWDEQPWNVLVEAGGYGVHHFPDAAGKPWCDTEVPLEPEFHDPMDAAVWCSRCIGAARGLPPGFSRAKRGETR